METIVHGKTVGSQVIPLLLDTDGSIIVSTIVTALPAGTNEIGMIQAREYGWQNAAWRKNPLSFGWSGQVLQAKVITAVAGTNTNDSDTVPANTIWIITNLLMRYTGTITNVAMFCNIFDGTASFGIYSQQPIVSAIDYDRQGQWYLKAGDRLRMSVINATAGDNIRLYAVGYYVSII